VLEVEAPLIEAQLVETFLINAVNLQTMIATKASRCFQAAGERQLVDFSLRQAQGTEAGLGDATIFASGALDEDKIRWVVRRGGDIDAFGVGTKLGVSADAPYLDIAYKMVEYAQRPALKLSPGKATWAGRKQVFRFQTPAGKLKKDIIGLRDDRLPGEPLLQKVMSRGKIAARMPSLPELRKRFLDEFAKLDERYKAIEGRGPFFPVSFSPRLRRLQAKVARTVTRRELGES
jgi:nicotinate phosphoribosyltransferase